jgi:microcystin degradation protein MlrC
MRYLGLKSSQHFKGWWKDHAGAIVTCDPPGIHCGDLSVFDFKYANTATFPFIDPDWEPSV